MHASNMSLMNAIAGDLGTYLRAAIDRHDTWTTVRDLATASGVSESNLGRYIAGKTTPTLDNARALAVALHRPLLEILVAAGLLTPDEARQQVTVPNLAAMGDDELLDELRARLARGARAAPTADEVAAQPGRYTAIRRRSAATQGDATRESG